MFVKDILDKKVAFVSIFMALKLSILKLEVKILLI